jgi:hypothetical protein
VSDPLTGLVKKIDETVNEVASKRTEDENRLGVYVIVGEGEGRGGELRSLAKKQSLKRVSLCIGSAPPRYEVNKDADVTVVIYSDGRGARQTVVSNFALREGELDKTKRDEIVAAISKALPR